MYKKGREVVMSLEVMRITRRLWLAVLLVSNGAVAIPRGAADKIIDRLKTKTLDQNTRNIINTSGDHTLSDDVPYVIAIQVTDGKKVNLDLNGKSVPVILVDNTPNVIIKNGTILGIGTNDPGIVVLNTSGMALGNYEFTDLIINNIRREGMTFLGLGGALENITLNNITFRRCNIDPALPNTTVLQLAGVKNLTATNLIFDQCGKVDVDANCCIEALLASEQLTFDTIDINQFKGGAGGVDFVRVDACNKVMCTGMVARETEVLNGGNLRGMFVNNASCVTLGQTTFEAMNVGGTFCGVQFDTVDTFHIFDVTIDQITAQQDCVGFDVRSCCDGDVEGVSLSTITSGTAHTLTGFKQDGGANIGLTTLLCSSLQGGNKTEVVVATNCSNGRLMDIVVDQCVGGSDGVAIVRIADSSTMATGDIDVNDIKTTGTGVIVGCMVTDTPMLNVGGLFLEDVSCSSTLEALHLERVVQFDVEDIELHGATALSDVCVVMVNNCLAGFIEQIRGSMIESGENNCVMGCIVDTSSEVNMVGGLFNCMKGGLRGIGAVQIRNSSLIDVQGIDATNFQTGEIGPDAGDVYTYSILGDSAKCAISGCVSTGHSSQGMMKNFTLNGTVQNFTPMGGTFPQRSGFAFCESANSTAKKRFDDYTCQNGSTNCFILDCNSGDHVGDDVMCGIVVDGPRSLIERNDVAAIMSTDMTKDVIGITVNSVTASSSEIRDNEVNILI